MAIERPHLGHFGGMRVVKVHVVTPRADIMQAMHSALEEISEALKTQNVTPAGGWFAHHYRRPTDTFDLDVCFPISEPLQLSGRLELEEIPEMEVIRTAHHGAYESLPNAWPEFLAWNSDHGYKVRADIFERYAVGPRQTQDPEGWHTDLICPLQESLAGKERLV